MKVFLFFISFFAALSLPAGAGGAVGQHFCRGALPPGRRLRPARPERRGNGAPAKGAGELVRGLGGAGRGWTLGGVAGDGGVQGVGGAVFERVGYRPSPNP